MTTISELRTAIADGLKEQVPDFAKVEVSLDGQLDEDAMKRRSLARRSAVVAWVGAESIQPVTRHVFGVEGTFAVMCIDDGPERSISTIDLATKAAAAIFNNDWGLADAQLPTNIRIVPYQNDALRTQNVSVTIVTFKQELHVDTSVKLNKPVVERTGSPFQGVDADLGAFGGSFDTN